MPVVLGDDYIAGRANTRVDDGYMHGASWKVAVGAREPESCFRGPVHVNLVRQIDDARCG